ncbi:16S rRNA (guanine1207-N2)-methyltransferase [Salirhabdus euzebyi]|uniref:16S rRNA (Guanine1207-N2)-methyltransferase n=1 Tax=Salirhabdus euzebyi TaxID=394506 RepID=A0A841Q9X8_9BACI|nr:class I SAM-dependent methyltransferase [Salirhabdus euzebyi]MBB6455196.1 16S rRNA (guanine1207-N2)-methyltransferase [Salirhabdus euzebyi]
MPEHYYSKKPSSKSERTKWDFVLRGNNFTFTSDYGVFSKNEVDFGSRLLVESFEEPKVEGNILDVGCGYGPIGLSLAKSFPTRHVHMVDVNQRAIELARLNATNNEVANVSVFESNLFENVKDTKYAAILTNPPIRAGKQVVHSILVESYDYLAEKGTLWVVIQKKQGAPSAMKKLEEIFEQVDVVKKDKGYFILRAEKFD